MESTDSLANREDMRRKFADREDLIAYLIEQFPEATAVSDHVSTLEGGRATAEQLLDQIDPQRYRKTRSFLGGQVSQLSAYLRHGVLSLAEVRRAALEKVKRPFLANKFVNELAWRDYYQRVYADSGDAIWQDREPYKTGFHADEYASELPAEIVAGETELPCIDGLSKELQQTGYLHNQARLWLAAYIVHWRRIKWQAGAKWFLQHLLDGDPASNNLSWQWVASTFSHKPHIFNRESVEKLSRGRYCEGCPVYGRCPFEGGYEELEQTLFPHKVPSDPPKQKRKRNRRKKKEASNE